MNMANRIRNRESHSMLELVKFDETACAPERDWLLAVPELDQAQITNDLQVSIRK